MQNRSRPVKSIRRRLSHAYGSLLTASIFVFFGLNILITIQLKNQGIDNLIETSIEGVFNNLEGLISSSVNQYLVLENESLITLARSYVGFVADGYIDEAEAKAKVLEMIGKRNVGESGYSYVVSYDGLMLQHPVQSYVGKDYSSGRGFPTMAGMDSGFIEYSHENPGDEEARSKILYMDRFQPWRWIIATTAYEKDPSISSIRLKEASTFIKSSKLNNIECISILDSRGQFLIPPDKDNKSAEMFRASIVNRLEDMKTADTGHLTVAIEKDGSIPLKAVVFFKYVPVLGWMIIAAGARQNLYSPVINAYTMQFFAIVISFLLLYVLNRLLAKKLTAPLNELMRTLDRNPGGESRERVEINTGDEFEILGKHFNNFLARQSKYLEDISEAQKSIRILAKFPDENPNPVIRLSNSGIIEYANRVAEDDILSEYDLKTGDLMPEGLLTDLTSVKALTGRNEFTRGEKVYAFSTTVISEHEGSYLFGRDITRQKKYESLQLLSENIFQNSIEGIVITDGEGSIESVNPAFTTITEFTEAEVLGKNPRILKSHRHSPEFYASMWEQLMKKGYWEGEIWNQKKSGEVYPEYLTITSIRNEVGKIIQFISFFHDLSDVKDREEKIVFEATHDQLTGLPNRIYLGRSLAAFITEAEASESRISVVYMDINNLKRINESIGPESGDRLLIEVAERMIDFVEMPDSVVRLGSDEFAFVFHNLDKAEVTAKIKAIADSFKRSFILKEREIIIDVSFGVSFFPDDGSDPMELVANAEVAMAEAKKDVNSIYAFYSPHFKKDGLSRLEIETGLKSAFERGEFYLNYQPKVSVSTGRIIGAEALVRVRPIEGQLIGPDVFIPVAEEIGLIEPLGSWVLERACTDTKGLINEGFDDFTVAVNLSPWQFRKAELPKTVSNIIRSSAIPARNLNLEITESMAIDNVEDSIQMMHKLTDIGLMLSIDDFGTGYSSLSYLSQFPVHILKIDKIFVVGIPDDPKKVGIVQAILSLAENLGMETVAEGVETEDHFNFLRDRGCQQIQGFYFYRPMPIAEVREILLTGKMKEIQEKKNIIV